MAVSFVSSVAYAANTGALPSFAAGDIAIVASYRDGNVNAPVLAAGWTNIAFSGANLNAMRVAYRVLQATDTSAGTWTNATEIQVMVLRGQDTLGDPIGANVGQGGGFGFNPSYTGITVLGTGSMLAAFAGHRDATNVNTKAVVNYTDHHGTIGSQGMHTASPSPGAFATQTYGAVNADAAWRTYVVEVLAPTTLSTSVAEISLSAGETPSSRTGHVINLRARTRGTAEGETLTVMLYEGSTLRSTLTTPELTTSYVNYQLAVPVADATSIGSYANLSLRIRGDSPAGTPAVLDIADVNMTIAFSSAGTHYGASMNSWVYSSTTNGFVTTPGVKQTAVARISLATGFTPTTRTNHVIRVRARRTALQGTLRVQLFEGATQRSAILETGELTTSLAEYTLNVADADAATISDYSALELRIWGYSSTGVATVFEVSQAELQLPSPGSGGDVFGALNLQSSSSVTFDTTAFADIYPGDDVFPHNMISVASDSEITFTGSRTHVSLVNYVINYNSITSADVPTNQRTGAMLLASLGAVTVAGAYERVAILTVDAVSDVVIRAAGQEVPGAVAISAASAVVVAGVVPGALPPATFMDGPFADFPDLLIAIAFESAPLDPLQVYSGVTEFSREASNRNGRQFELNRVEAGSADLLLDNNDGRFNPENSSGPYYPNVIPTRRLQIRAAWSSVEYDIFHGYLEGYPQEYPSQGYDNIVKQHAVDGFMALQFGKMLPGSTVLTSAMAATTEGGTETIEVQNTALPMPQAVPFSITIDLETMSVTEIVSSTQWVVDRGGESPAHVAGTEIHTENVSFGEEYSGTRIRHVLERLGIPPGEMSLEAGQTLLAPSENLSGRSGLEHILLVAEVEFGRFFAANDGIFTFHDRHHNFLVETASRATFGDEPTELPYFDVKVTHANELIYNIIRIKTADETVVEVRDEDSITDHFERPLDREWPLADNNDATSIAHYMLERYSQMVVRIPELTLKGRSRPSSMWPIILDMQQGQRYRVIRRGPGVTYDKQLVLEGVQHIIGLDDVITRAQMSLADTRSVWKLNVSGFGELGQTTYVAF